MDRDEAIDIINHDMMYKPGYKLKANKDFYSETHIVFGLWAEMYNSSLGRMGSIREIERDGTFEGWIYNLLDVSDIKERDELFLAVLSQIIRFEQHEAREFLRDKDRNFDAPLHPHNPTGMLRYAELIGDPTSVAYDMTYGVV